jgi:hypothetical protein
MAGATDGEAAEALFNGATAYATLYWFDAFSSRELISPDQVRGQASLENARAFSVSIESERGSRFMI